MEKERYYFNRDFLLSDRDNDETFINANIVRDRLNQQDTRIKELEEQLNYKNDTIQNLLELQTIMESCCSYQMLLDCQDQKAIEVLEKEREWIKSVDENGYIFAFRDMNTRERFNQKLDNQIKELRGQEMIKIIELDSTSLSTEQDLSNNEEIEFTEDLRWQYQLDDLDKLISKAQDIENIARRLKELKERKAFAIKECSISNNE